MSENLKINKNEIEKIKDKLSEGNFLHENYKGYLDNLEKEFGNLPDNLKKEVNDLLYTLSTKQIDDDTFNENMIQLKIILENYKKDSSESIKDSSKQTGDLQDEISNEKSKEGVKIHSPDGGFVGKITSIGDLVSEAFDESYEKYVSKENLNDVDKEEVNKQLAELQEELSKLELSGEMSLEDFQKQISEILKNKKFDDVPAELLEDIEKALVSLKESQQIELGRVNDFIDSLYRPNEDPKAVFFKDENGNEKKIEFSTPEEAQTFVKDLKSLAKEELDKTWGDAIFDFFGDASEWALPFTNIRKLISGKHDFWSKDNIWLAVEAYVWYAIGAFVLSGAIASVNRRLGDVIGSINTKNQKYNFRAEAVSALKTMTPLDINSDAGKDFLELKNRHETLSKLYEFAETINVPDKKNKVLKEIKELDEKFFLRRSDTFDLKAFKIMEGLGLKYDIRIFLFEGARIRFPILHKIPKIGQWGWVESISKKGLEIRKSEDFVNYIKSKDIEDTDGLKNFYDIDKDNKFTLKKEKLDSLLAFAELEWKAKGISDENITKYKQNLEDYIKNLEGKKEHTVSLNRNIQLFIEKPAEMHDMKSIDKSILTNKIKEINEELTKLKTGTFPRPLKKKELNRQLRELEIFQRYIFGNNWFGTKKEFKEVIENIIKKRGEAGAKILDKFKVNNDYLKNSFEVVSKMEVAKKNFGIYLNEKLPNTNMSRLDKINTLIDYYLPTDKEVDVRKNFKKLQDVNLKSEEDYKKLLKDIVGVEKLEDIDSKLSSVSDIVQSYKLDDSSNIGNFKNSEGKIVTTKFNDSGHITNAIKQRYGLDDSFDREITKISDSIAGGNKYTIGQLTYLIEKIKLGEKYEDLKSIDWFSVDGLDLGNVPPEPSTQKTQPKESTEKKSNDSDGKKGKKGKKQQSSNNNLNNQNQSPNNSKENLTEKSKKVGKILDRLETQLLLEGNLSKANKKEILNIQNQYLDKNKLDSLDIGGFERYLEGKFSIGLKTAKDLKTLIKVKDILDVNGNKINFDIDFKISDFIKGVREGKFKLKF